MVVSAEYLIGSIDEGLFVYEILTLAQVILDLVDINLRNEGISIKDSDQYQIRVDSVGREVNLFEMFNTPRNVTRLSFLLELSLTMNCVSHVQKTMFVARYQLFCFQLSILFMGLHSQKN